MNAGEGTQNEAMIALLLSQVEELKRDKDDLRADKAALKKENARLVDELQRSLAASHLNTEDGRGPQSTVLTKKRKLESDAVTPPVKKGRQMEDKQEPPVGETTVPKKRGRPPKTVTQEVPRPQAGDIAVSAPKRRGRPPKGLKTAQAAPCSQSERQAEQEMATLAIKYDEAFIFTKQQSEAILKDTPTVVVGSELRNIIASRDFFHKTYGGSPYQTVQIVQPHKNPSGTTTRMLLFPANDVNPYLPTTPGQPGFLIDNRYFRKSVPQPWSMFRRVSQKHTGLASTWLYLGEYEYTPAGKMSVEIFNAQPKTVQTHWAEEVLSSKHSADDVHLVVRARVALRKAGLITALSPKAEVDKLVEEEMGRIAAGEVQPVDVEDIVGAFSAGEEAIDITILKCVSYDEAFAQDIASKLSNNGTPRSSPTGKDRGRARQSVGMSAQQQAEPSTSAETVTATPSSSRASRRLANMFTNPPKTVTSLSPGPWVPDAANGRAADEEVEDEAHSYGSEDEVASLSYP